MIYLKTFNEMIKVPIKVVKESTISIFSQEEAFKCVDEFLNTGFEGGRHSDRIAKNSNRNLKNI